MMRTQARIERLRQPVKARRQVLYDAFNEEIRKTLTKILAAGLYTREQLDAMTHEQFCAVIVDYDFDYGERVVDKASIALDEFDLQHGC